MANEQTLDIEQIKSDVAEKANELIGQAVEFAKEKPHVAVGAAFAIGWVLGNGLPPRVIMGVARLGWKAALGGALAGTGLMGILGAQDEDEGSRGGAVRSGQPGTHRRSGGGEGHARARNNGGTASGGSSGGTSGAGGGSAVKD